MVRVLRQVEGARVLDIGCYAGGFASELRAQMPNADVLAVDYDVENLRIARVLHPQMAEQFQQMSAYELELPDASFDCVTFQEVIEHLEGAAIAIKEINRVLRIGGSLIVTTPSPYYWRHLYAFLASELRNLLRPVSRRVLGDANFETTTEWNRHIYCWTPSTLLTLLAGNGFAYESHEYSRDASSRFEHRLLRVAPFVGPVIVLKVRKVADAPARLV
jgi:ubiquinone/menaquinone biosynthesis C-methylase UbiE